jgi:hypothetical protein
MKMKFAIFLYIIAFVFIGFTANRYVQPILTTRDNYSSGENGLATQQAAAPSTATKRASKPRSNNPQPVVPLPSTGTFTDAFDATYTVVEEGGISGTNNPNWWVSSGAYMYSKNGQGSTIVGDLSLLDPWRVAFSLSNALDTDNGYHPQNIFRLVQTGLWKNFEQQAYFKVDKNNLSESPNRNASNGLLFFNRYQDEFNLYYSGIRVDGYAVIKKKINGSYYTMAYKPLYAGDKYDRLSNPNLIPQNQWIGMKTVVKTNADNTVSIQLYVDKDKTGNWTLAAEAKDDGKSFGGSAFLNAGHTGIRTDFMDVYFDDYLVKEATVK